MTGRPRNDHFSTPSGLAGWSQGGTARRINARAHLYDARQKIDNGVRHGPHDLRVRALAGLRGQGCPVLDADVARLPPYVRPRVRVHGHHTVTLPDLSGRTYRAPRDPDAADER
ncbi:hypothetical protein [Umezawaea sp.]|uniref:hypothetical protein n=1 Tax=Umezawaea sp. TaxID=1955258 RepID=UPI002ED13AAF